MPLVESLFSPYFATLNRTARQDLPKAAALSHLDRVERQDYERKTVAQPRAQGCRSDDLISGCRHVSGLSTELRCVPGHDGNSRVFR